jgi:hypothetical protein
MPGLVPGIHVAAPDASDKDVDGRVKPGHDELTDVTQERICTSIA